MTTDRRKAAEAALAEALRAAAFSRGQVVGGSPWDAEAEGFIDYLAANPTAAAALRDWLNETAPDTGELARQGRTLPSTARHALQSFGADWPEWAQVAVNDVIDQAWEARADTGELARLREALERIAAADEEARRGPGSLASRFGALLTATFKARAALTQHTEEDQPLSEPLSRRGATATVRWRRAAGQDAWTLTLAAAYASEDQP